MAQKTDTDLIAATLAETVALHERFRKGNLQAVADAVAAIVEALRRGGKLLLFGNGGSAADAQHVAAELVGRFEVDRAGLEMAKARGLRTIALTGHDGGHAGRIAEIHINVRSESTARVQEVHRTVIHVICDLVEKAFASRD